MGKFKRSVIAALLLGILAITAGCASLKQAITLEMVYPNDSQAQITVHYTVPPPPPGKVYVLWLLNPDTNQRRNVGQIPGGQNQTVETTVDFQPTGAIVSVEDSPSVTKMSNVWALKVGQIDPSTPTPTVVGPTPTPLPFAH